MSGRMLVRIAVALAVLVFAWGALAILRRTGGDAPGGITLPRVTAAELTRIAVRQGLDSVVVEQGGGAWRVNGLPAAAATVERFLAALNDSASSGELVSASAQSHERLAVDTVRGRRLTVGAGERTLLDLWIGRRGPDFDGFYVRRAGEAEVYLLRGAFAEQTALTVEHWRDLQVVRLQPEQIGRIEVMRGGRSWSLSRTDAGYTLGTRAADSATSRRLFEQVANLRGTAFPDSREAPLSFTPPDRTIRVLGREGALLAALALDSTESGAVWARREADGLVFKLDGRVAELITPRETDLH